MAHFYPNIELEDITISTMENYTGRIAKIMGVEKYSPDAGDIQTLDYHLQKLDK